MLDGEKQLIANAKRRGGASSFGKLYDYYQPKIYRFVYLKVSNREEAEDITHQVFLSAWQNIKAYTFQGFPFSSWLYRIARNRVIDHYRTSKSTQSIEGTEAMLISSQENIVSATDNALEIERIQVALKRLPLDQQDVLIMRFVDDMPHKDIAAALKKTEGAVKVIQHRALKKLKGILGDATQEEQR